MRNIVRTVLLGASGLLASTGTRAEFFVPTNLVSNQPGVARLEDPDLVNPWGVSFGPTSPVWVSNNGTGTSTLYSVDGANIPTKVNLTVIIPGDGSVTGQVNTSGAPGGSFNGDNFLFVSEDGTISGWRGALGDRAEILQTGDPSNVYKGAAFATIGDHSYLLAAEFRSGTIDVIKGDPDAPNLAGRFEDPGLPSGFAPFNVQNLGGTIFVAYAKQGSGGEEETGVGLGFVSKFDLEGNFIGRVATQGPLDAPWGMAIAPDSFGSLGGSLLVGNFGDGRINAYDLASSTFIDQLRDASGNPLSIDGLWSLTVGNGSRGGSADAVYFTAGPDDEANGLFGVITVVPEPSSAALLATALATGIGVGLRRRRAPGSCPGRRALRRKPRSHAPVSRPPREKGSIRDAARSR